MYSTYLLSSCLVVYEGMRVLILQIELRNVGFRGEEKTGEPGEKPLGARTRTNNKLNPHVKPRPGIKPGPHG